jgi:carboxymethylenebutenolidase
MGEITTLKAADGFTLSAYRARPQNPRGGVVVVQEIFGVNSHIRDVADRFAAQGYDAIAPAVFDRIEPGFECGYSEADIAVARGFIPKVDWDKLLLDIAAARDALAAPVGIVGYCLGGSVAYLAAARLDGFSAAIGYYGGKIAEFADEAPRCPTQLHYGEQDAGIPMSNVETVRAKRPEVDIHISPAGHGFNCDQRASYHGESAKLAETRTLGWLEKHLG